MTTATTRTISHPEAAALNATAIQLVEAGREDQAILHLFRALTLAPNFAMARLHLGEILLRRGEYMAGWREFEWGSRLGLAGGVKIHAPQWNGMRLPDGNILLLGSQGFGDVIQFARYIPLVADRCRHVGVGCSPDLQPLLRSVAEEISIFTEWQAAPPFAVYAPLTSLPYLFATTVETIPSAGGYLTADAARLEAWRVKLRELAPAETKRAGLVWAGRPTHLNDHRRSMAFETLLPLLDVPGVAFFALQKILRNGEEAKLAARGVKWLGPVLHDFADTAAVIANLDLVITVDTSIAHLAGALGKPVWILLPHLADWRWLTGREDSPWYASARLFQQERPGDWAPPLARVRQALEQLSNDA